MLQAPPRLQTPYRAIRLWLIVVAALLVAMVMIGGATRLTGSGLSIVEWQPVTGLVPPLSEAGWREEFAKYQEIPQFKVLNSDMTLDEFRTIYWWEWTHRALGRLIGAVFLIPFLWFLWRGGLKTSLRRRLSIIFVLGAIQGAIGWWMVASGLAGRLEVSQYRLATHLTLACLIYTAVMWTLLRLDPPEAVTSPRRIRLSAAILLLLVLIQIYLGALVAGLQAGLIFNTWPLIDGTFIPPLRDLFSINPLWRNVFESRLLVQFDHRMVAYLLTAFAMFHVLDVWRSVPSRGPLTRAMLLFSAILAQAALGIVTLLQQAPIELALVHQAMAVVVLTFAVSHASGLIPAPAAQTETKQLAAVNHER
jgi:cytochrome c oxidase assembly protein subunit 15